MTYRPPARKAKPTTASRNVAQAAGPNGGRRRWQPERRVPAGAYGHGQREAAQVWLPGQRCRECAGYGTAHTALPTDAGYGMPAATNRLDRLRGLPPDRGGQRQRLRRSWSGRPHSYNGAGMYGQGWYGAAPRRSGADGLDGRPGVERGHVARGRQHRLVGAAACSRSITTTATTSPTRATRSTTATNRLPRPTNTISRLPAWPRALPRPIPIGEWMPLGVFALVQNDQSDPHYIMQLAVNKSGALAGNYSDLMSGTNVPIQGAVDKKTQRVAWTVGDNKPPWAKRDSTT